MFCSKRAVIEAGLKRGYCRIEVATSEGDAGEGSGESEEEGSSNVCGVASQLPRLPAKHIGR